MPPFLSLAASSKPCTPRAMLSPSCAPGLAAGRGGAKEGGREGDPASLKPLIPRPPPPSAPPPFQQQGLKGGVKGGGVGIGGSSNGANDMEHGRDRGRERDRYRGRELDREREEERERERQKGWESSSRQRGWNCAAPGGIPLIGGVRGGDAGGYRRDDKGRNDGGRDAHGRHGDCYGDRRGTGKSPEKKISQRNINPSVLCGLQRGAEASYGGDESHVGFKRGMS
jgi:hypothetical protein